MQIVPKGQLRLNYLRSAYPFQLQPSISLPDYSIDAHLGNAEDLQSLTTDPQAGAAYAKPIFVPHNQKYEAISGGDGIDENQFLANGIPDFEWDEIQLTGASGKVQAFGTGYWQNQTLDAVWDSEDEPEGFKATFTKDNIEEQGFVIFLSRSVYFGVPANRESYYEIRFKVAETEYSIWVSNAQYAQIRSSTDSWTSYVEVAGQFKFGGNIGEAMGSAPPRNGQKQTALEILFINGRLQLKFGSQTVPYVLPITPTPDPPVITKLEIISEYFTQFGPEVHPLKFATEATMRSNFLSLGFSPQNSPYYYIAGIRGVVQRNSGDPWDVTFPENSSVTVSRVGLTTDIEQQYDLELLNEKSGEYGGRDYADKTVAVTRVTIHVDGVWATVAAPPVNVIPRRVSESTYFDLNSLTINQTVTAVLDNVHGQWRGQAGNIAMQMALGYANPSTALFPRFTGMCGDYDFSRPRAAAGDIVLNGTSLMVMLSEQPIINPPLMDGWNHYYAMAFLAQMAGITLSQMAFAALVPADPFSAAPGDPNPYFLPLGEGMRPWTPRNREQYILQLMDYVRRPAGFLLFFDAQGYLRYEPWIPPLAGVPKRIFKDDGVGDGELTEYWNFRLRSSVRDVRNQIVLLGIDPYDPRWKLFLRKLEDTDSIYAAPGTEPKNYVGYKKPFVWSDPRFADSDFATEAALRLYNILRIPGLTFSFDCWMQPDLYPMDTIYINEWKSGTENIPFYVTSTTTNWGYEGGGKQSVTSSIQGRFLV